MPKLSERQIGQLIGSHVMEDLRNTMENIQLFEQVDNRLYMRIYKVADDYGVEHERAVEVKVTVRQLPEGEQPYDIIQKMKDAWQAAKDKAAEALAAKNKKIEADKAKREKLKEEKKKAAREQKAAELKGMMDNDASNG